jgi:hypothetical protein
MREQRAALRWYRASVVHANWNPIVRRFKHYIALPKARVERPPSAGVQGIESTIAAFKQASRSKHGGFD